jgi:hypothetical protein
MIVPTLALVFAGVYVKRHYSQNAAERGLVDPGMFKVDWAAHTREVLRVLREYEAAQSKAREASGACGDAMAQGFRPATSVPYDFDDLKKDEGGAPLDSRRCALAANPRDPDKDAWVYLMLIEDGAGEILMAPYSAVGTRLSGWPTAEMRARFRPLGAGMGTAPQVARAVPQAEPGALPATAASPMAYARPRLSNKELIAARTRILAPILDELNEEGLPMGVKFSIDDVLPEFRETERRLMAGSLEGLTPTQVGLNPPATEELDREDERAEAAVKCLVEGEWKYMSSLPISTDGGITECRYKSEGKDKRGFEIPAWHVYDHFSPARAAWSPYTDEEYAAAVEEVITQQFESLPDVDAEQHAERLSQRFSKWDKLRRKGGPAALNAEAALRAELIAPFRKRMKIAAGRHVVELITGKTPQ